MNINIMDVVCMIDNMMITEERLCSSFCERHPEEAARRQHEKELHDMPLIFLRSRLIEEIERRAGR